MLHGEAHPALTGKVGVPADVCPSVKDDQFPFVALGKYNHLAACTLSSSVIVLASLKCTNDLPSVFLAPICDSRDSAVFLLAYFCCQNWSFYTHSTHVFRVSLVRCSA